MALNQTFNQDASGNIVTAASVTTAAPSYTTGTNNALSLTLTGLLRVDGSNVTQPISATTLPLPAGAATEATLAKIPLAQGSTTSGQFGVLSMGAVTTAAPTYTTAQSSPLSLTTAGALRVDASGSTQPVSGTVTVVQPTGTNLHVVVDSSALPTGASTSALQTAGNSTLTTISGQLPPTLGPNASGASLSVVQATGTTFSVSQSTSATGTLSSVALTTASQTLLASNAARKGFIVYNDSLNFLYIAFAATASTSVFSSKLQAGASYVSDTLYTGTISGIASVASGNARITEFT